LSKKNIAIPAKHGNLSVPIPPETGATGDFLTKSSASAYDMQWGKTVGDGTNYTQFDSTGHQTMVGTSRPWRDALTDAINIKSSGVGVSVNSTESTVDFIHAAALTDFLYCNIQLNHDKDLTATIYPHIHWFAEEEAVVPNFLVRYRWQVQNGTKVTDWTNLKCNTMFTTAPAAGVTKHAICGNATGIAVPVGTSLSDIVQFKIIRDHDNASTVFTGNDPYTATVSVLAFDCHFMINSLGSTDEYTK